MVYATHNEVCNKISLRDTGITAISLLQSLFPLLDFHLSRQIFFSVWIWWTDRSKGVFFFLSSQCATLSLSVKLNHFVNDMLEKHCIVSNIFFVSAAVYTPFMMNQLKVSFLGFKSVFRLSIVFKLCKTAGLTVFVLILYCFQQMTSVNFLLWLCYVCAHLRLTTDKNRYNKTHFSFMANS